MAEQQPPVAPARKSVWTPRRIAVLALLVYGVILVILNRNQVAIDFVFFKTEASLFVVLILAAAFGFVFGWLFDDLRERRRRRRTT